MRGLITKDVENAIIELLCDEPKFKLEFYTGNYKTIEFRVWDSSIVESILKEFKFKDVGSILDYPDFIPQPEEIRGMDFINIDKCMRICVSKKNKLIFVYSSSTYETECLMVVRNKDIKSIGKRLKPILKNEGKIDIFKDVDFNCKKGEFVEVFKVDKKRDDDDYYTTSDIIAVKKKVDDETLVFNSNSEIFNVMHEIKLFFTDETKKMYKDLNIVYKRGIILYGDPGNGKSAMIREIIRSISNINKIVINPSTRDVTNVLDGLISKLNKQKTLIVIEDIDSLITPENRSEFLNILDGVNIKSGIFFIGTTNYPERIDPAFMNRSGRFDRTYKIENPDSIVRRAYFELKGVDKLMNHFIIHEADSEDNNLTVIDLFTKYSEGLSMAALKELMVATLYKLASKNKDNVESAIKECSKILIESKRSHVFDEEQFNQRRRMRTPLM